jgi:hypothetical protein
VWQARNRGIIELPLDRSRFLICTAGADVGKQIVSVTHDFGSVFGGHAFWRDLPDGYQSTPTSWIRKVEMAGVGLGKEQRAPAVCRAPDIDQCQIGKRSGPCFKDASQFRRGGAATAGTGYRNAIPLAQFQCEFAVRTAVNPRYVRITPFHWHQQATTNHQPPTTNY